jgi:hypothetical protein
MTDVGDGNGVEPLITDGIQETFVTIEKTQHLEAPGGGGGDHAVKNCIETGAIAAAGEYANPFRCHQSGIRA